MKKRSIVVTTGARADYGILRPILDEIKNSKKPEVGFGVVGKKMLYKSLFSPNLVVTSPFVLVETKATAHIPFLGYSTRQALSNELFD